MTDNVADPPISPDIDTTVPHSPRVWNYWLGGKDNFAIDREVGDMVKRAFPGIIDAARHSRAFLGRAVRFMAGEAGIRQFLDIGTGLPTADNTHDIAQNIAPESRIAYVDNDPMVLSHARVLLTSTPQGATTYVDADMRDVDAIVQGASKVLDFSQPVAVMFMGILGHVGDDDQALSIVRDLLAVVPSGSYMSLSDGTNTSPEVVESHRRYNESGAVPYHLRSPDQIARFFGGLELVDPGVVRFTEWRPDPGSGPPEYVDGYCGVARKP